MPVSPPVAHLRSKYANAVLRGDEHAKLTARRELKAAVAAEYIQRIVDTEPPLTVEQRALLAALLTQPSKAIRSSRGTDTVAGGPDAA